MSQGQIPNSVKSNVYQGSNPLTAQVKVKSKIPRQISCVTYQISSLNPPLFPLYTPLLPLLIPNHIPPLFPLSSITKPWHHISKCTWGFLWKTPKDPILNQHFSNLNLIISFRKSHVQLVKYSNLKP